MPPNRQKSARTPAFYRNIACAIARRKRVDIPRARVTGVLERPMRSWGHQAATRGSAAMKETPQLRRLAWAIVPFVLAVAVAALLAAAAPAQSSGTRVLVRFKSDASSSGRVAAVAAVSRHELSVISAIRVDLLSVPPTPAPPG